MHSYSNDSQMMRDMLDVHDTKTLDQLFWRDFDHYFKCAKHLNSYKEKIIYLPGPTNITIGIV